MNRFGRNEFPYYGSNYVVLYFIFNDESMKMMICFNVNSHENIIRQRSQEEMFLHTRLITICIVCSEANLLIYFRDQVGNADSKLNTT